MASRRLIMQKSTARFGTILRRRRTTLTRGILLITIRPRSIAILIRITNVMRILLVVVLLLHTLRRTTLMQQVLRLHPSSIEPCLPTWQQQQQLQQPRNYNSRRCGSNNYNIESTRNQKNLSNKSLWIGLWNSMIVCSDGYNTTGKIGMPSDTTCNFQPLFANIGTIHYGVPHRRSWQDILGVPRVVVLQLFQPWFATSCGRQGPITWKRSLLRHIYQRPRLPYPKLPDKRNHHCHHQLVSTLPRLFLGAIARIPKIQRSANGLELFLRHRQVPSSQWERPGKPSIKTT